jgi:Zn-dependent protease with chaperone function
MDTNDRAAIWGGLRIFELSDKRLQVTRSYGILTVLLAIVLWIPVALVYDLLGERSYFVTSIPLVIGIAVLVALIAFWLAVPLSTWGLAATSGDGPRVARAKIILQTLCMQGGIDLPELWLDSSAGLNATSLVRPGGAMAVVVTQGVLDQLSVIELESVLAREVERLRSGLAYYDVKLAFVRKIFALVGLSFLQVGRAQDLLQDPIHVDLGAMVLTRFPPALVSVLERLMRDQYPSVSRSRILKAGSWQWLNPSEFGADHSLLEGRHDEMKEW